MSLARAVGLVGGYLAVNTGVRVQGAYNTAAINIKGWKRAVINVLAGLGMATDHIDAERRLQDMERQQKEEREDKRRTPRDPRDERNQK